MFLWKMHQWMCFDNPPDTSAAHLSDASSEARQKDIRSVMRIGGASVPQLMQEVKDVPVGAKHQRGADGDGAQRHGHPSVEAPDLKHTGRRSLKGTAHLTRRPAGHLKGQRTLTRRPAGHLKGQRTQKRWLLPRVDPNPFIFRTLMKYESSLEHHQGSET